MHSASLILPLSAEVNQVSSPSRGVFRMIECRKSGQTLPTAQPRVFHLALRSRSSLRPFKSSFVNVQLESFSESASQHILMTLSNWTVGRSGSHGRSTRRGVPCMGGGTSGGDVSCDEKFGGKTRVFGLLPSGRARAGPMGEDVAVSAFRRCASFCRASIICFGVKTSMGLNSPPYVTFTFSGVIYGLMRDFGIPSRRGSHFGFFPLRGVCVDLGLNTEAEGVRVDHVGSEGLR